MSQPPHERGRRDRPDRVLIERKTRTPGRAETAPPHTPTVWCFGEDSSGSCRKPTFKPTAPQLLRWGGIRIRKHVASALLHQLETLEARQKEFARSLEEGGFLRAFEPLTPRHNLQPFPKPTSRCATPTATYYDHPPAPSAAPCPDGQPDPASPVIGSLYGTPGPSQHAARQPPHTSEDATTPASNGVGDVPSTYDKTPGERPPATPAAAAGGRAGVLMASTRFQTSAVTPSATLATATSGGADALMTSPRFWNSAVSPTPTPGEQFPATPASASARRAGVLTTLRFQTSAARPSATLATATSGGAGPLVTSPRVWTSTVNPAPTPGGQVPATLATAASGRAGILMTSPRSTTSAVRPSATLATAASGGADPLMSSPRSWTSAVSPLPVHHPPATTTHLNEQRLLRATGVTDTSDSGQRWPWRPPSSDTPTQATDTDLPATTA